MIIDVEAYNLAEGLVTGLMRFPAGDNAWMNLVIKASSSQLLF
jgi:hypothetical protein